MQREGAYSGARQELAALLVTKNADDALGTCGNRQKAVKEVEPKYPTITNETTHATQEAFATSSMTSEQDPDNYTNELTRPRKLLTGMITDKHFTDIGLQF